MELLRHEQVSPFIHPTKPAPETESAEANDEAYATLRREFDADLYGRVSLKRIANLSR
ncbi:hypothetical protein ACVBR5_001411 [Burkholderia cenocepacia]